MKKHSALHCAPMCGFLVAAFWLASCGLLHDGPHAFQASQKAAIKTTQFNVVLDRTTKIGEFKESMSLDCAGPYFYDHEVDDLSAEGIESGRSLSQGRPSAHQESEMLFAEGKEYGRNTSSWENASANDARPEWHPISMLRNAVRECDSMKKGEGLGYVGYDLILKEGHIKYLGGQRINGHRCSEYEVNFDSQVVKSVKVCLGSDDLPYRVIGEDYIASYDYNPVKRVPNPAQAAVPHSP